MADRNLRIRMQLEAMDKVTRPLRDITGGSTRAAQALKATRDRLKEIERAQADVAGFRQLKQGLRTSEQELQAAQTRVAELARAMEAADTPTKKLAREFANAKKEAATLRAEHERETAELQRVRDRLAAAGIATSDLVRHERDLRTQAASTNAELADQERRLRTVTDRASRFAAARERFGKVQGAATGLAASGASGIATGMTLGRPLLGGIKEAQEFQSGMTDIAQKATLGRDVAEKMGAALLVAARTANQLPEDIQKGTDALAGFGLKPGEAARMMEPIGKAATAYKAEIADLSAAAFAANDNLKVPVEQTARVIDIMAQAGKSGAFEIKDMAGAFPALTAGYQALGQTGTGAVADLAAALQIARKGAGDSATAANNVANVIQKIASPATIKAFSKFGVDLPNALKKAYAEGKTPLEAIAELTKKATGGDLGKLGFLFEDAQVQQGLRPLIQNMDKYREIRAEAMGAKGVTDGDFAERLKDSAEQSKRLEVNSKVLAITMGTMLLPTVNSLLEKFNGFAEWVSAAAQRHPVLAKGAVMVSAAFAGLFLVLGGGAIALAALFTPIAMVNAGMIALGVAGGVASIGLLPIIGTVAAIVLGVTTLALAAYAIYANWGKITGWFAGLWGGVKAIVSGVIGWFAGLPSRFGEIGRNMIAGLIRGIMGMLGTLKATIVDAASAAAGWFKAKLGIHSPSRVFHAFGDFMMEGLSNGIAAGANGPVQHLDRLSKRMTAAIAVGAAMPGIAVAASPSGSSGAAGAVAGGSRTYNITINGAGHSPQDVARMVADEIDRRDQRAAATRRSSFRDLED